MTSVCTFILDLYRNMKTLHPTKPALSKVVISMLSLNVRKITRIQHNRDVPCITVSAKHWAVQGFNPLVKIC